MAERPEPIMLRPVRRPNMAAVVEVAKAIARRRAARKIRSVKRRDR